MSECAACATLAREMENFEAKIHEAILVPVPDGLAARVLLRQQVKREGTRLRMWALAASVVLVLGLGLVFLREGTEPQDGVMTAAALGDNHPAVAAISYVLDHEPQLLKENRAGDPTVMREALMQLGLALPAKGITVRYLGKCPVPPGGTGEHVVLQTAFGHVTLILVPSQPFASRAVVAYRDRTAIASPARAGGYILVADSLNAIRQLEKMLM